MPSYRSIHFGCRANQADAAAIEQDLLRRGFVPADTDPQADFVILNSCTVTASADADLRQAVRRVHRETPRARILVTGCYAQRCPEEIAALPGVEWVVGNSHKSEVGRLLASSCAPATIESATFVPLTQLVGQGNDIHSDLRKLGSILVGDISSQREYIATAYFGGAVEDRTRPNLKIQDGCNNRCSFCIIPSVRGLSRSLPSGDVIKQIQSLTESGYREVVLSGVNLGQYSRD